MIATSFPYILISSHSVGVSRCGYVLNSFSNVAVLGPGVVLLCALGPDFIPATMSVYGVTVNEYSLVYMCCLGICALKIVMMFVFGSYTGDRQDASTAERAALINATSSLGKMDMDGVKIVPPGTWDGEVTLEPRVPYFPKTLTTKAHVRYTIVFFSVLVFLMNLSVGFYMATFQPILVNVYNYDQAQLAEIAFIYCGLAVVPPLIVSIVAKRYTPRSITFFGLLFKLLGMLVYAMPPGHVWQLVVGYVLVLKGALFFLTSLIALLSQVLAKRMTPVRVGIITSFFALGK
jgi:hypothetical protein